jgi:hypothetical protein
MNEGARVSLRRVSEYYRIDFQVVLEWAEFGLYTALPGADPEIDIRTLGKLKRIISLHRDLGINKEGIEVILGLSQKVADLESEVEALRSLVERQKTGWAAERAAELKRLGLFIEID